MSLLCERSARQSRLLFCMSCQMLSARRSTSALTCWIVPSHGVNTGGNFLTVELSYILLSGLSAVEFPFSFYSHWWVGSFRCRIIQKSDLQWITCYPTFLVKPAIRSFKESAELDSSGYSKWSHVTVSLATSVMLLFPVVFHLNCRLYSVKCILEKNREEHSQRLVEALEKSKHTVSHTHTLLINHHPNLP